MANAKMIYECIQTLPKVVWWKLKYGKRFSVSWKSVIKNDSQVVLSPTGSLKIGERLNARMGFAISCRGKMEIGKGCFFNKNCAITSLNSVTIGEGCFFGNNVVVVDHDHDYKNDINGFVTAAVKIGDHAWIGANSVILRGVEIGAYSVVAAGSVVRHSIPPYTLYYETRTENYIMRAIKND